MHGWNSRDRPTRSNARGKRVALWTWLCPSVYLHYGLQPASSQTPRSCHECWLKSFKRRIVSRGGYLVQSLKCHFRCLHPTPEHLAANPSSASNFVLLAAGDDDPSAQYPYKACELWEITPGSLFLCLATHVEGCRHMHTGTPCPWENT